jgi:hypothetical protein
MDFKFGITWLFDKLGYMPKIDMQVGKVNLDVKPPDFQMWPFPVETEKPKKQVKKPAIVKKRIALKKATTRKPKATLKKVK